MKRWIIGLVLLTASPCFSKTGKTEWIDLTHPFDDKTIHWPTSAPFQLKIIHRGRTASGYWYETNEFEMSEHSGTHLDAPVHFSKGSWTTDKIPIDKLIGKACVLDVSKEARKNPDYQVTVSAIEEWEKKNGSLLKNCIFLLHTGWSRHWNNKKKYLGMKKAGDIEDLHFPGFSREAAGYLAKNGVVAVGLDTPSLDHGPSREFWAHRIFGKANIPGFENVANLDRLPAVGAKVIALPMKIGGGSGGPLRIVAKIPLR